MAQLNDNIIDKGGFAPHKNCCDHAIDAINISSNVEANLQAISLSNANNGRVVCSVDNCWEMECWFCLKCHLILCGRYGNQHMMEHYQSSNNSHCMAMGINDLSFWCFECDDYINHLSVKAVWDFYLIAHVARFDENIPDGLTEQTTFGKREARTFVMQTIEEESKENDIQHAVDDKETTKL